MSRLTFLLLLTVSTTVVAQDFSNKGRDFWVGYGNHVKMISPNQANAQEMVIYITSAQNASFTIEIPRTGWSWSGSVMANSVISSPPIPKSGIHDARLVSEGIYEKGIHITSDRAIVAYTHIYNQNVSGATMLFPVNVLGVEYYSINFTQRSNEPDSYSYFYVIATEDNTEVEIIPSKTTKGGRAAGVAFNVSLMRGQVYNVLSAEDLTGSRVRSVSTGIISCRKIAVFSGTGKIFIACSNAQNSADNVMQQAFPSTAWGKKYLTAPTRGMPNNFYRVAVNDPATVVTVNGTALTGLQNNFYYEFQSNTPNIIEASQPVMVAQYITTQQECGNTSIGQNGDPEMIYLSPVEQTIDKITLNSTPNFQISSHYINVILKASTVSSFRLDGVNNSSLFVPHPVDPAYSYATIQVSSGPHQLRADSGFNAIAYGYGNLESYGYNAGTNVIDLYQYITITNANASTNAPAACKNLPFSISLTLPYEPSKLTWEIPAYPTITDNAPAYSQTIIKNGKTLYVYQLPGNYVYAAEGVYSLKVTANNPTTQGCSGLQELEYDFEVYGKPVPDFSTANACSETAASFSDISNLGDRRAIQWFWDFGDNTNAATQQAGHVYNLPGTYNVRFAVMSDIGCVSDTISKSVIIKRAPVAKFGATGAFCVNNQVLFSDSSVLKSQVPVVQWHWEFGDVSSPVIHTTAPAPFYHTYSSPGTYVVRLVVKSSQDCYSVAFEETITIHSLPVADFTMPARVCLPDGATEFTDQSTSPSTNGPLVYKWYFADPNATDANPDSSIVQHPVHIYSQAGPYAVRLFVVSPEGCKASITKSFNAVFAQAQADFSITKTDSCAGATLNFADHSDGAGRTMATSHWDFGDGASTQFNDTYTFTIADTFYVRHYITTTEGCHSDTVSKEVIIHPIPVAGFNPITPRCELQTIQFADASSINGNPIVKWDWSFGDNTILNTTSAGASHTYDAWGSYTVALKVETDKGCKSNVLSTVIQVNPLPVVSFLLPEACLLDPFAGFTDQSSIADNTESQFSYLWNFGDANSPGDNTSLVRYGQHHYTTADHYDVKLTVTSVNGCAKSLTQRFTLNGAIPVADFTIEKGLSACNDSTVQIRNISAVDFGNITKLEIYWDNGNAPAVVVTDNTPVTDAVYNHVYPPLTSGGSEIKQIRMRAFSGDVCVSELIKTVTIHAKPQLAFLPLPDQCIDAAAFRITQASEVNGLEGHAVFSGPGIVNNQFDPGAAGAGTYIIKYSFLSEGGCPAEKEQSITVWGLPVVSANVTGLTCEQSSVQFVASGIAAGQSIDQWSWNFNDNSAVETTGTGAVSHPFTAVGNHTVSLQAITNNGCRSTVAAIPLVVHPLPVADFSVPKICLPLGKSEFVNLSTITDGTESQFSYAWNFGDPGSGTNNLSSVRHPVHFYSGTGPYQVRLTVTSNNGCISVDEAPVTEIFNSPVARFESLAEACVNSSLAFRDISSDPDKPVTTWKWQLGNNIISTQQHINYTFNNAGPQVMSLSVTNSEGCTSDIVSKDIKIYAYPVVNAGPDLTILEGESAVIHATAQGIDLHYEWVPGTYLNNATLLNPTITPAEDDNYRLVVTGRAGCIREDNLRVKVLKLPKVPNTFTPNGDGVNDVWEIRHLITYPQCVVEVYNPQGQLLFRSYGYNKPWDGRYNGNPLPVGTYYYVIDPKEGRKRISGYVTILR